MTLNIPLNSLCATCGSPLRDPAFVSATVPFCSKKCYKNRPADLGLRATHAIPCDRISDGEKKCEGPGCTQYVAPGYYARYKRKHFYCSEKCCKLDNALLPEMVECACGCGQTFRPRRPGRSVQRFISKTHAAAYKTRSISEPRTGQFYPLLERYLNAVDGTYYKKGKIVHVRVGLSHFFWFLRERGIFDLNDIAPRTVTDFVSWARSQGKKNTNDYVEVLPTFFEWLYHNGLRRQPSPVVAKFAFVREARRKARPFSEAELESIWNALWQSGTPLLRAAAGIGEDSGFRYSEVLNIRLEDLDLDRQQLFVRLPTKNDDEAWVPFTASTKEHLLAWLNERPNTSLDYLFVKSKGEKPGEDWLRREFKRVLCNPENPVMKKFSFHRFRHCMGTALGNGGADLPTIMAVGRWRSPSAAEGYIKMSSRTVSSGYLDATNRIRTLTASKKSSKATPLAEFARSRGKNPTRPDCV